MQLTNSHRIFVIKMINSVSYGWRNEGRKPEDRKVGCLEKCKMKKMNSFIRKKK